MQESLGSKSWRHRLSDEKDLRNKSKSPPRSKKANQSDLNDSMEESEDPNGAPKDRKLSRSKTAQGNLTESTKLTSHSLSKSQSSSNLKTELPESNPAASKRTESQNLDRVRVQHQNFNDKNDKNKESSDGSDVNSSRKKEITFEPNGVIEEVLKSDTSPSLEAGISNNEKTVFPKEKINNLPVNTGRVPMEN